MQKRVKVDSAAFQNVKVGKILRFCRGTRQKTIKKVYTGFLKVIFLSLEGNSGAKALFKSFFDYLFLKMYAAMFFIFLRKVVMNIFDTMAHLYGSEELSEDRQPSIRQTSPLG